MPISPLAILAGLELLTELFKLVHHVIDKKVVNKDNEHEDIKGELVNKINDLDIPIDDITDVDGLIDSSVKLLTQYGVKDPTIITAILKAIWEVEREVENPEQDKKKTVQNLLNLELVKERLPEELKELDTDKLIDDIVTLLNNFHFFEHIKNKKVGI